MHSSYTSDNCYACFDILMFGRKGAYGTRSQ